jgi:hypothetical protein
MHIDAVELEANRVTRHHASGEDFRSAQHNDCELSPTLALLRVANRLFAAINLAIREMTAFGEIRSGSQGAAERQD